MMGPLSEAPFWLALVVGLGFGALLERSGLGSARTIAQQLTGKDFTVVKVMLVAIVNQWRATLRLEDATADQLPGMMERLEVGGHSYQIVDLQSAVAMLGGDRKARILVAFTTVGDHSWFFKVAGDSSLVAEQRPVLLEFLKSVEFPIQ